MSVDQLSRIKLSANTAVALCYKITRLAKSIPSGKGFDSGSFDYQLRSTKEGMLRGESEPIFVHSCDLTAGISTIWLHIDDAMQERGGRSLYTVRLYLQASEEINEIILGEIFGYDDNLGAVMNHKELLEKMIRLIAQQIKDV
jgi:hypothetical protein